MKALQRACDPSLHEPNYAIHLELAEYINNKKANTPRESAMAVVRLVNHRNPHVNMLALSLLDSLVQACGYPFHLQISTKEFLNELVRRFPERPPPFPGPVMQKILETIHGWKEGIASESRWKEDLGNVRDMHRLLSFKGYRFRDLPRRQDTLSSANNNLKSPDELESEDREAQGAKLQELIRRGTPRDLAAAQELMKVMAGANPDAKPDYRSQSLTELNKLQQKVILLNEMLDNVDSARGERFVNGDVYHQVSLVLVQARPKIQKWISDAETEDPESLEIFLQMNDQINTVLSRYESFKKGDYTAAANPIPPELASSSARPKNDLIDLLDDDTPHANNGTSHKPITAVDELADVFGSTSTAATGPVQAHASQEAARSNIMAAFNASPGSLSHSASVGYSQFAPPSLFETPGSGGSLQGMIALPLTPELQSPLSQAQAQTGGVQAPAAGQTAKKDPFADLEGLF